MFLLGMMGNITLTISILMRNFSESYLLPRLPWIIGSLGTVFFDAYILIQCWLYKRREAVNIYQDDEQQQQQQHLDNGGFADD